MSFKIKSTSFFFLLFSVILLSACSNPKKIKNVSQDEIKLYIPTGASLQQVFDSIRPLISDLNSFEAAAQKMDYKKVYPGRYTFTKDNTNEMMLNKLIKGEQDEIKLTIGNYCSIFELANKVSPYLNIKPDEIIAAMAVQETSNGLDTLQWIYCLAPNTYHFHWNTSGEELIKKLREPYIKFWNGERKQLLQTSGMTELQVVSLASIVQLESYKEDEQPRVAGLYLNRIKKGMKLDADPTVIFLMKKEQGWDKKIQRVYYKDLARNSPYNTYRYAGIPPGPICMPNPSAIDAVLKAEKSDYIYFVADPDRPGYHTYARNAQEHEINAKKYRDWANKNNIK